MSTELLSALGAFLSGVASVLTAMLYIRHARKEWEQDCQQRLEALKEGIRMGHEP